MSLLGSDPRAANRILFVHAHPDDESIGTGATMAKYAAAGAQVTLVTCTRGEEGEIIPAELRYLAADKEDRLGEYRIHELATACAALGVRDHRFLGAPGRWRDSGMQGAPTNDDPRAFWQADVDEAARALAEVIREVRPQVVVSYDDHGLYGHPDHIQAHRVTRRAVELAGEPAAGAGEPWTVARLYATALPFSALRRVVEIPDGPFDRVEDLGYGVPDEQVTTVIDAGDHLAAKLAALRAHRTQVVVDGQFFALSNNVGQQALGAEYYTLLVGERGPAAADGRETDLFAGIEI
jgi:N-acetyl-1-D-myo-inositol-2-amino-2-deoxy-alpha-D-glucopyranoside deacetylase